MHFPVIFIKLSRRHQAQPSPKFQIPQLSPQLNSLKEQCMDLRSKLILKTEYWFEERWLRWSLFLSCFCSRRSRWNFWILGQLLKETLPSSFCQLKYFVLKTPQNMQSYCFGACVSMFFFTLKHLCLRSFNR